VAFTFLFLLLFNCRYLLIIIKKSCTSKISLTLVKTYTHIIQMVNKVDQN